MGLKPAITIEEIKSLLEDKGAKLISTEYMNNHTSLDFLCAKCGLPGKFSWKMYCRGENPDFLCKACNKERANLIRRNKQLKYSIDWIREEFKRHGAELVTTEYKTNHSDLWFKCSNCGNLWKTTLASYLSGKNTDLLCETCNFERKGFHKYTFEEVQQLFKTNSTELCSKMYSGVDLPLEFKCKHCGNKTSRSLYRILHYTSDHGFYCNACLRGRSLNPNGKYGGEQRRHLYDLQWFKYVYTFFNLTTKDRKKYSIHHIKQFVAFEDYRTSLCNGYPIQIIYHVPESIDPITGEHNPFHSVNGYLNAIDFPDYVKLPYHNYSGFNFLDLNSKLITEIIAPTEDMNKNYLLDRKNSFEQLYVPLFFDELFVESRLFIVCSLIRRLLYQWFPDIYLYTGQSYTVYNAENLVVSYVACSDAKNFLAENNLYSFIQTDTYLGLFDGDILVMLLCVDVDGIIRACVEKKNCVVKFGFQTLVQFLMTINESLIFVEDVRFPIFREAALSCGFVVDHVTEPNLFYMNLESNRFFKSMQKEAQNIKTVISCGMPVIHDTADRLGFVKVFDCGETIYAWKKESGNN